MIKSRPPRPSPHKKTPRVAFPKSNDYLLTMTTAIIIVLVAAMLILTALAVATDKFVSMLTRPKVHSHEESRDYLKSTEHFDCNDFENAHEHETFMFTSPRGYSLRGIIMHPNTPKTDVSEPQKAAVIVHGYTGNYSSMYPYAKVLLDNGFNVVLYDHRMHGISDRKDKDGRRICCSMGYFESKDLKDLFYHVKTRFDKGCVWGLLGESMGGAIVMQTAPEIPELSFVIDDCGYSSMEEEAKAVYKGLHMPSWPTMQLGNAVLKHRWKWSLYDVDAIKAMKRTTIPVLFCHGDADTFVPTYMAKQVYDAKPGEKTLRLYKGSTHARSVLDHPQEYEYNVKAFLKGIGL